MGVPGYQTTAVSMAEALARIRGFVLRSSPAYLLFLGAGLYLGYPVYGTEFWALVLVIAMFAAVDAFVLYRIAKITELLEQGVVGEPALRRQVASTSRLLFGSAAVLGILGAVLLAAVASKR